MPVELLTGTVGSTVRLPYVPNSMVMDRTGNNLYFGSPHELMIFTTSTNTLTKQDTSAFPAWCWRSRRTTRRLLINDQVRQVFYHLHSSGGTSRTFGGMGAAAAWTPDSKTLYITDSAAAGAGHTNTLYVYNVNQRLEQLPSHRLGHRQSGAQRVAVTSRAWARTAGYPRCPYLVPLGDGGQHRQHDVLSAGRFG